MCEFFSCVSDGNGNVFYFDEKLRVQVAKGELNYDPDSHTSIADYFGFKGAAEDKLNKWEYNPKTAELTCDTLNTTWDHDAVEKILSGLNFKKIKPLRSYHYCNKFTNVKRGEYVRIIANTSYHDYENGEIVRIYDNNRLLVWNKKNGGQYIRIEDFKKLTWLEQTMQTLIHSLPI